MINKHCITLSSFEVPLHYSVFESRPGPEEIRDQQQARVGGRLDLPGACVSLAGSCAEADDV